VIVKKERRILLSMKQRGRWVKVPACYFETLNSMAKCGANTKAENIKYEERL
jgi:hypothetical protein